MWGAVSMGTGVMIGAGIFAITGQMAEAAGEWFPWAFLVAGLVAGLTSYTYVKMSQRYPSAGGIAMFLEKAYGKSPMTGTCALLMYVSMVINESLVARTFGTYTLQLFDVSDNSVWVPVLGSGLVVLAFLINLIGNKYIQTLSFVTALLKVGGLLALAAGGLWATGFSFESVSVQPSETETMGFIAAVALGILGYKGFTTITNSGGELKKAEKNVGRAIIISLSICLCIYLLVAFAVAGNLDIDRIIEAKNYALAEGARPAFGNWGVWLTVGVAIIATVSGIIASVFAVSRMLAMLSEMKIVPHSHFGMPGDIQKHTLVYTAVLALVLTIFFDLSRIASLGAVFYIVMDIAVHYGVLRHLRKEVGGNAVVLVLAILLDVIVLTGLLWLKWQTDFLVV